MDISSSATAGIDRSLQSFAADAAKVQQAGADPGALAAGMSAIKLDSVQLTASVDAVKMADDSAKSILNLLA